MEKEGKKWHLGVVHVYCDGKYVQFEELRPRVHYCVQELPGSFVHSLTCSFT